MVSSEQVLGALRQVMHPEMKHNLVELEMIKDTLIPRLNEAAGLDVIDDVVFR